MIRAFIQPLSFLLLLSVLFPVSIHAEGGRFTQVQASNFDFDDNIMFTGARIMVWDKTLNKEIPVSTQDWAIAKTKLGKEGEWKNRELKLPDGLRYFGDTGPRGADEFRKQIEEALDKGDDSWKGPSFDAFVKSLSVPKNRAQTSIISARLHSPKSIMAGLKVLKDRGLIPALPDEKNLYAVGYPGLDEKFKAPTYAESKAKVMISLLDEIEKTPVPEDATLVNNQNGTGLEKLHLWGFSDDDFENFERAEKALSAEVKKGRWPHVKIVLYFTGTNNPNEKPRTVVIQSNGETRPATKEEAMKSKVSDLGSKRRRTH